MQVELHVKGIQHVAPVENFPDDRWETVLSLNLSSNFYAIKAVLPMMKARGYGRIINIASAHGKVASVFKVKKCNRMPSPRQNVRQT
jgi:3-hydroxybutyrate dehydrogenase